ncbi:hypothetical protein HN014_03930 [Aquimarina sp. TRL1]|uniref:hypothetical protein n=1 Tax=Aquimarina sp. (strain TRL1) TaxID=2736252 RepID=UPI00158A6C50|nr:hypothetical protein [Aquimarina sp. TRL1]QKX04091.1 hypothetical protein HN014_03930 [Aquimarina sp. TRL1]
MHTASKNPVALGVIGLHKEGVYSSGFQISTIPEYKKLIRANSTSVDFNKTTFNTYLKADRNNSQEIKYVDSLESKPQFLTLEILDRVGTIAELQQDYNTQTFTYLKSHKEAAIVTSVSLALPKALIQEINNAEAIFLSNHSYKQYQISLVKEGKLYKTIDFAEATIFAYELSFFCWGENDKKQINMVGIIDEKASCSKNTYQDAEKAKGKMNYFKL